MMFPFKYIFFIFLFLILFWIPFFSHGSLFVLDFVIPPFTQFQPWYSQSIIWHFVDILNFLFWTETASKTFFLWTFILWTIASLIIAKSVIKLLSPKKKLENIIFLTSLFFIILNPFTYERMITQPWIIGWVFCFASWVACLVYFTLWLKNKWLLYASLWFWITLSFFPHSILFIPFISIIFILFFFKKIPKKYFFIWPLIVLFINANWILWDVFYNNAHAPTKAIEVFDRSNIEWFLWNSLSGLWTELTHLMLYGFWAERFHILTPDKLNRYWYLFWAIVLLIILCGAKMTYKKERKLFFFLSIIWWVGYILALGISSCIFWPVSEFLYLHMPWYIGMREPQKWLWISMIVYSFYFLIWVYAISEKYLLKYTNTTVILLIVFTIINAWNPLNLWSYQGQLYGITYPQEYFTSKDWMIKNIGTETKVLLLPWHSYMACKRTRGKVIGSMGDRLFYPLHMIVSDNLEIDTKYTNSSAPISKDIDEYLKTKDKTLLIKNDIKYIINLSECADYKGYIFLEKEPYLKKIRTDKNIDIYQVTPDEKK